jgi:hypothetical protein
MGTAAPPLDQASAAALAQQPMRRLETRSLEIYYPEARRELALRVAARLEYCTAELKRRAVLHIQFLVKTYGEQKLWQLVAKQGRSLIFPFFISNEFRGVYGTRWRSSALALRSSRIVIP